MKILLDTPAFLWWITGDPRISPKVSEIITDGKNELFLSAASIWEMVIKSRLGRLQLPKNPGIYLTEQLVVNTIQALSITIQHALRLHDLPNIHKDPFDRIIIAQSVVEEMPILTQDDQIAKYNIKTIW